MAASRICHPLTKAISCCLIVALLLSASPFTARASPIQLPTGDQGKIVGDWFPEAIRDAQCRQLLVGSYSLVWSSGQPDENLVQDHLKCFAEAESPARTSYLTVEIWAYEDGDEAYVEFQEDWYDPAPPDYPNGQLASLQAEVHNTPDASLDVTSDKSTILYYAPGYSTYDESKQDDVMLWALYRNTHIYVFESGLPGKDLSPVQTVVAAAKRLIDVQLAGEELPIITLSLLTTPLRAVVHVRDSQGNGLADKRVSLRVENSAAFRTILDSAEFGSGIGGTRVRLPDHFYILSWARGQPDDFDGAFRTNSSGIVEIPLFEFAAAADATEDYPAWYARINAITLAQKLKSAPSIAINLAAELLDVNEQGQQVTRASTATSLALDHIAVIASLTSIHSPPRPVVAPVAQAGKSINVSGTMLPTLGYPLQAEAKIEVQPSSRLIIRWVVPTSITVQIPANGTPTEITILPLNIAEQFKFQALDVANDLGVYLTISGLALVVVGPGASKVAGGIGTFIGITVWGITKALNPLLILPGGTSVYIDLDDEATVYTLEGTIDLYDWVRATTVSVATGEKTTVHDDGSVDPATAFTAAEIETRIQAITTAPSGEGATAQPDQPAARPPQTLFEETFDEENGGVGALNYTNFANWSVTVGGVDLIGHGFYDFHPEHGLYVDMDGTADAAGSLTSRASFDLQPGQYQLEFDLAGNPYSGPNTLHVTLGDIFHESFTRAQDTAGGFEHISRLLTVSQPTKVRLTFAHEGNDWDGLLLDNVRLVQLDPTSADEPPGDTGQPKGTMVDAAQPLAVSVKEYLTLSYHRMELEADADSNYRWHVYLSLAAARSSTRVWGSYSLVYPDCPRENVNVYHTPTAVWTVYPHAPERNNFKALAAPIFIRLAAGEVKQVDFIIPLCMAAYAQTGSTEVEITAVEWYAMTEGEEDGLMWSLP